MSQGTQGKRKSVSRKSVSGGKRKSMGGGGGKKKSVVSEGTALPKKPKATALPPRTRPIKPLDLFEPPYPIWEDWAINETKWDEIPELSKLFRGSLPDALKAKSLAGGGTDRSSAKSGAGKRQSTGGKRQSTGGKRQSTGGKRQSTGGKRQSTGGKRQSTGGKRQSTGGKRQSTGGKRQSTGGKRQSTGGKRQSTGGQRKSMGAGSKKSTASKPDKAAPVKEEKKDLGPFVDPEGHAKLPSYLKPALWRRAPWPDGVPPTIDPEEGSLDLYTRNTHLFQYKIMRLIISSVMSLERAGTTSPFPVEFQTESFASNVKESWKPWHHVYSLTKAGEGSTHKPLFNPFGLYYVRIYYMGEWRRVAVDEFLPYDAQGQMLLPVSKNPLNIWMPLLTKALLKVAAMSWTSWDDSLDFDPIVCLTGWLRNTIDARFMKAAPIWRIIQSHLISQKNPERPYCVPLDVDHCIHETADVFLDQLGSRYVFLEFSDRPDPQNSNQIEKCPLDACYNHYAFLARADNDTIPDDIPKWKTFRWVDWAMEKGYIRGRPGTLTRIVELYAPLKKKPPDVEFVTIQNESDDTEKKILLKHKSDVCSFEDIANCIEKIHVYYRPPYFEYVETLDNIPDEIIKIAQSERKSTADKRDMKKFSVEELRNMNITGDCFYLYSDTQYCKYFLFTLMCHNVNRLMPAGMVMAEGWQWNQTTLGPSWFSLRTYGMKSQAINLGPGLQIVRVWYSLPQEYLFMIHSKSSFQLVHHEMITTFAAKESASFFNYGLQMADAYSKLIKLDSGSSQHTEQLAKFITTFCPPYIFCSSIPSPVEPSSLLTTHDLMPLFEEKVMELLYDQVHPSQVDKIVGIVLGFQRSFLDEKFGENYLAGSGETYRLEAYKKITDSKKAQWDGFYLDRLNHTRRLDGLAPLDKLPEGDDELQGGRGSESARAGKDGAKAKPKADGGKRQSSGGKRGSVKRKSTGGKRQSTGGKRQSTGGKRQSTGGKRQSTGGKRQSTGGKRQSTGGKRQSTGGKGGSKQRSSSVHGGNKGKSVKQEIHYNQFLLENPVLDANLLRQMVKAHDHLLRKYPFRYDDIFRLNYFDVASVTEQINYPTKWLLVGRIWLNVHSRTPVPVGFTLFTDTTPVSMSLYDLDKREEVPLGLNVNANYYIKRNEKGYVVLVHGWPAQEKRDKSAQWRVRCFGANIPDIPHGCSLTPPYGWTKEEADRVIKPYDPGAGEFKIKEEIKKEDMSFTGEKWGVCKGEKGPNPILTIHTISGNYIPNYKASICRFLITMPSDLIPPAALVTLCLSTSKPDVKINLTLKGKDGKVICDNQGIGNCVVPAVFLFVKDAEVDRLPDMGEEYDLPSRITKSGEKETIFFRGKAVVVENSWNFTKQEAEILELIRKDKSMSTSTDTKVMDVPGAPLWKLIMVVDNQQRNDVLLAADRRYEDNFKRVRDEIWEAREPGRKEKGLTARMDFLNHLARDLEEEEEEEKAKTDLRRPSVKMEEYETPITEEEEATPDPTKDFVQIELGSRVMSELYYKHRNPLETPDFVPRVVHLKPVQIDSPSPTSQQEEFIREKKRHTLDNIPEEEDTEALPDKFKIIDPILEEAQLALKEWGNKNIKKAYDIRDEIIEEMKKERAQRELDAQMKQSEGRTKEKTDTRRSQSRKSVSRKSVKRKSMKRQSVKRKSMKRQSVRRKSKK